MNKFSNSYKFWLICFPYFWLFLFILGPLILVLALSFSQVCYDSIPPYKMFFNLHLNQFKPYLGNFELLFSDRLYLKSFWQSIYLSVVSTFVILLIAYPMAYAIAHTKERYRNIWLVVVIMPFWTSLLIRVYAWMMILKNNGLLNKSLLWLGIINEPLAILNSKTAVIIGMVYTYLPFMILPLYSVLAKIDQSLVEAAQDLGCKSYKVFWKVTFPLSMPGVISGCLLVFIPSIGEFVIPDLLGGAEIITIGKVIWGEFFFNADWPLAAAITVITTLIISIPIFIIRQIWKWI